MAHPLAPDWLAEPLDPNALHSGVWPASAMRGATGELEVGGVSASALAAAYGTPVMVIDRGELLERARAIQGIVEERTSAHRVLGGVYYASKSLITGHIAAWLAELGLGFDVATGGELEVVLRAGVDPARIEFQGNNKSIPEIERAVSAGVGTIVIDAAIEADRIAQAASNLGVVQSVMVRVNTGVHADTHEYLATAREDQKFGLSPAEVIELVGHIRETPSLRFIGLHSHIGSQIFALEGFLEAATRMLDVLEQLRPGGPVEWLNLGGGFGIAYTNADAPLPATTMLAEIIDFVHAEATRRSLPMPHLAFEPGRVISGPAGVTLYTAGVTKPVSVGVDGGGMATRLYVSVDGGMSDNARPALYSANYSTRLAQRSSDAAPALVRVVGKHCESGDIVVRDDYLPSDVRPGDLVAVATTGAYCYSLASNYNMVAKPPVVWVDGGRHGVMVEAESLEDVLGRDRGLSGE